MSKQLCHLSTTYVKVDRSEFGVESTGLHTHSLLLVKLLKYRIVKALSVEEPILEILYGQNGLHTFSNNSAESEPI